MLPMIILAAGSVLITSGPESLAFGRTPLALQVLADIRSSATVAPPTAGLSIEAGRSSYALREVTDNWNFHEGLDLIFAGMVARQPASAQFQPGSRIDVSLWIGSPIE